MSNQLYTIITASSKRDDLNQILCILRRNPESTAVMDVHYGVFYITRLSSGRLTARIKDIDGRDYTTVILQCCIPQALDDIF